MPRKPRPELHTKTSIRLPPALKEAIHNAAAHNGRSANDEMLARLAAPDDERLNAIERELHEMKGMLRKILDATG
ncbi:Arc family DNA-binding protein [Pseudoduganella sp. UC29_106]|uniref:Arc family DNA-binding protein n=1 Tax=Pseudoduganella sp. UC29_106 TaxID=3374553 RepID=UPI00375846BB